MNDEKIYNWDIIGNTSNSILAKISSGKPGSWRFSSESDSRWSTSGRAENLLFSSGLPREATEALNKLRELYGEPPDDLEFWGIKD